MKNYRFSIIIEKDKNGFFAFCPELQGCYTQGRTYDEVRANIGDAIKLHIQDRTSAGEKILLPESVSLSTVEVAV